MKVEVELWVEIGACLGATSARGKFEFLEAPCFLPCREGMFQEGYSPR